MKQIRRNIFETNSSSSHSIVLTNNDLDKSNSEYFPYFETYLCNDGTYDISNYDLTFGRSPFDILCTFSEKLNYAIASFGKERFHELEELACKYLKGLDGKCCSGIKLPSCRWSSKEDKYYGEIDHQSIGILQNFLFKENISLEEFLTNSNYIVIIDGDEYCVFEKLKESGLIKSETVKKEYQ